MNHPAPEQRSKLVRMASIASMSVAITLIALKLGAWLLTGSLSLLSTLVDSVLDIGASMLTFVAVRYALQPPDDDHRFGHGKAEDIAALAQSAFIVGSALFIAIQAVDRIITPREITHGTVGVVVMLISLALTLGLVLFQRYVVRATGSSAIRADSLHYLTDVLVAIAVIVSLFMSTQLHWILADPLIALAVAGYIFYSAAQIGYDAFQNLMDREFPDEERQQIMDLVIAHPNVRGIHALKTRRAGMIPIIQFHLELDGEMRLRDAHTIVETIDKQLREIYPGAELIIHEDPAELHEPHRAQDKDRKTA